MKIWTIKEGEPLPIPECPGRQMRCGIISEMLAQRGHDVTWWTSDFFHQTRTRLREAETVIDLSENYRLHMLHAGTVYHQSISLARIRYSTQLGKEFRRASREEEKPDVIFCAYPLIDVACEAVAYGKEFHVPVVVDIRDLWPDIFWEHFGSPVSGAVKALCAPLRKKVSYLVEHADVTIGIIPKCLQFVEAYGRKLREYDGVYYLAYQEKQFSPEERAAAEQFWREKGLSQEDFILCWFGQINTQRTDFCMVADVVAADPRLKFIVCGDGPSLKELTERYRGKENIIFTGFLGHAELDALTRISSVGMIPIRNSPAFSNTINNKAIEYMAGSLCIGTTLSGLQKQLVEEQEMGFWFETGERLEKELDRLIRAPELLNLRKENARRYFEANFRSETVYGKLCGLLEELGSRDDGSDRECIRWAEGEKP